MKKLTLLPVLLLASLQLNGALSRLVQSGRQLAPTLRSQLSAQAGHLPAAMPKSCPAGMRLLSSSSRSQDEYGYAGQQASFGGREALLLSGALAVAAYNFNTPEEHMLKQAYASSEIKENETSPLLNIIGADYVLCELKEVFSLYNPENNAKFERFQFLIDNSSKDFRQEAIEELTSAFVVNVLREYAYPRGSLLRTGPRWWSRFYNQNTYIKKVDLYLSFANYIVEKYPESAHPIISRMHEVFPTYLSNFTKQQQQRYKEIEKMYYEKMDRK